MKRRPTVRDVANAAGVSQATVSYVLNDTPGQTISQPTKDRIFRAVKKLGYVPSRSARILRLGRSDMVLVLLPDAVLSESYAHLIDQISDVLEQRGYSTIFRRKRTGVPVATMVSTVDPATVVPLVSLSESEIRSIKALRIPLMEVGPSLPAGDTYADFLGYPAQLQVEHLVERGHQQIGYLSSSDPRLAEFARPRISRLRAACEDRGLPAPVVIEDELSLDAARAAVTAWQESGVTAVATFTDEYAFAVLAALRSLGLTAPADLAVIGAGNTPASQFASPPLTTVETQPEEMIERLSAVILSTLGVEGADRSDNGDEQPELRTNLIHVVAREST